MNERYFVICRDEDDGNGPLIFATHGYFTTRSWAESYARTLPARRAPQVVLATGDFYPRDASSACGS
ncbi:hypothetical protein [Propionivibrio sp.]|uniref:hypothetical protein n=1 Tax=Propionivibrio sp. TaxID=2212460 RepID=UPI0039E61F26